MDFRYSLAGLFVGILIGLTGMGGGSLLAPILILFFHVPPVWAVS
nr:sulfite exporter TauE/SafE family protein [Ktedonobacteraceae bacterium]